MPTTNNDAPQVSYDQFQFYVGMASDYFVALQASYENMPGVSSAEKAAIASGLSWLTKATLSPAQYYSAYQSGGWTGLADHAITSSISNIFVGQTGAWATAGALALGLSGGAAFMTGLGAGVAAGALMSFGLNWATGGSLTGTITGLIDYVQTKSEMNQSGKILPDGSIVLDEIVISSYGKFEPVVEHNTLWSELNGLIKEWNDNYTTRFGSININADELIGNNIGDWVDKINSILGPNGKLPDSIGEAGRPIIEKIKDKVDEIIDHYKENKEELDSADPSLADKMQALENNIDAFYKAAIQRLTPLVIDLSGEGIETISWADSKASFDFGDDAESSHGWIAPTSGFLALDKNNNGIIDDISELFGSKEADGFTMLSKYDDNGDGLIDENDAIFSQLKIWTDLNGDGRTDDGELISISDLGIVSISLNPSLQNIDNNGNWIPLTSEVTMADGSTREIADVYLTKIKTAPDEEKTIVSDSYVIQGGTENDRLEGTEKDQIFSGGLGADTFVFRENIGNDIIVDFQVNGYNHDILEIHNDAFMDANDVLQHMYQDGNDTILSFDHDNTIRIINTVVNDFNDYNIRVA